MSEQQELKVTSPDEGQSRSTVMLERNKRVQTRLGELMCEGKHGYYESLFRVVREEVEAEMVECALLCRSIGDGDAGWTKTVGDVCADAIMLRANGSAITGSPTGESSA